MKSQSRKKEAITPRLTSAAITAIEQHAIRGPRNNGDVSKYMAHTRELRKHVLLLVAELREPRQERLV